MTAVLRRSGAPYVRDGVTIEPRAIVAWCDTCGAENAAFSEMKDGKRVYACHWINGAPGCPEGKRDE